MSIWTLCASLLLLFGQTVKCLKIEPRAHLSWAATIFLHCDTVESTLVHIHAHAAGDSRGDLMRVNCGKA